MPILISPTGRVAVVTLQGELDMANADDVRRLLREATPGRSLVVVDMADVTFIDSTIMGVIVAANTRCTAEGGALRLANLQRMPAKVIALVGLDALVMNQPSSFEIEEELSSLLD